MRCGGGPNALGRSPCGRRGWSVHPTRRSRMASAGVSSLRAFGPRGFAPATAPGSRMGRPAAPSRLASGGRPIRTRPLQSHVCVKRPAKTRQTPPRRPRNRSTHAHEGVAGVAKGRWRSQDSLRNCRRVHAVRWRAKGPRAKPVREARVARRHLRDSQPVSIRSYECYRASGVLAMGRSAMPGVSPKSTSSAHIWSRRAPSSGSTRL